MKPRIKVYNGERVDLAALQEAQTQRSEVSHLLQHFSNHPSRGLTPTRLAAILSDAETGNLVTQCELAEDMEEKDAHIFSELQKRKRAMLSVDWVIEPPKDASREEIRDAEMITEWLEDSDFLDDLILDMGDAITKGFSATEMTWNYTDKLWLPDFEWRDPAWFKTHSLYRNEIRLRDNTPEGQVLNPLNWVVHRHQAKSGYLARTGLVRVLAWPYLFKNYSVRDLAEFLEIYGLPLRLGKYPTGATRDEKSTLLKAVMSIGHNAGGIIPKGMDIEFKDAAKGTSDPYKTMITWAEQSQSKAILGGTLTSQADGATSTNALGNVHNEVRQELRDSDVKQIGRTLTEQLIMPFYMLNGKSFTSAQRRMRFSFDTKDAEDLESFSTSLNSLVGAGMRISRKWAHEKANIPEAVDDKDLLTLNSGFPPQPTAATKQAIATLRREPGVDDDATQAMTEQLGTRMQPLLNDMTDEVKALVENATSLEELQDALAELDISSDEVTRLFAQMILASELAGRSDVEDGV
jgi:phage gp29-like protein